MTAKDNSSSRGTLATMVATAAVTLAIGVTVAALGGYLNPRPAPLVEQVTAPEPPIELASKTESPTVVLVPVTDQPRVEQSHSFAPVPAEPEPVLAVHAPAGYDDEDDEDEPEHRARGHHEREEDEHDD